MFVALLTLHIQGSNQLVYYNAYGIFFRGFMTVNDKGDRSWGFDNYFVFRNLIFLMGDVWVYFLYFRYINKIKFYEISHLKENLKTFFCLLQTCFVFMDGCKGKLRNSINISFFLQLICNTEFKIVFFWHKFKN